MNNSDITLCLFTNEFPYGFQKESFLENEIDILAEKFKEVIIFPSSKKNEIRNTPKNIKISDCCILEKLSNKKIINLLFKNFFLVCYIIIDEIRDKGVLKFLKGYKTLLKYLAEQLVLRDSIITYFNGNFKNKVFYDYWFSDKTLALALIKFKYKDFKFISRAHGFDLYDHRWNITGVPFRHFKLKYMEKLFVISKYGKNYLANIIPKFIHKVEVEYLGVKEHKILHSNNQNEIKVIVSCSNVIPLKCVEKIPKLLSKLDLPIKWIHFGDGPSMKYVKDELHNLPHNIQVELKGHVKNQDVISFYQNNKVDLFISLSETEGLPVSMMEAISFNIPIVAYNIEGIPEIVIDGLTGFLLSKNFNINENANIVLKALNFNFNKDMIQNFYLNNFNSKNNYSIFAEKISTFKN